MYSGIIQQCSYRQSTSMCRTSVIDMGVGQVRPVQNQLLLQGCCQSPYLTIIRILVDCLCWSNQPCIQECSSGCREYQRCTMAGPQCPYIALHFCESRSACPCTHQTQFRCLSSALHVWNSLSGYRSTPPRATLTPELLSTI